MSSQRHNACNVFEQKRWRNYQSGLQRFPCIVRQKIGVHFKYFQIKTYVQTAREYDLNKDFPSFDNGFEQLCVTNFMHRFYCMAYHSPTRRHVIKVNNHVQMTLSIPFDVMSCFCQVYQTLLCPCISCEFNSSLGLGLVIWNLSMSVLLKQPFWGLSW